MEPREHRIRVIIPDSYDSYETGTGESCSVVVDDKTKKAHGEEISGGIWSGTLDNDSWYYPGVVAGDDISFEMRGSHQSVATWKWIKGLHKDVICSFCGSIVRFEWDYNFTHPFYCPRCDQFRTQGEVEETYHASHDRAIFRRILFKKDKRNR